MPTAARKTIVSKFLTGVMLLGMLMACRTVGTGAPLKSTPPSNEAYFWATTVTRFNPRYSFSGVPVVGKFVVHFSDLVPNGDGIMLVDKGDGSSWLMGLEALREEPIDPENPVRLPGPPLGEAVDKLYTQGFPGDEASQYDGRSAVVFANVYWAAIVTKIEPRYALSGRVIPGKYVMTLSTEVPNDSGFLLLQRPDASWIQLALDAQLEEPIQPNDLRRRPGPGIGSRIKVVYAQYQGDVSALNGAKALVVTDHFPNVTP